MVKPRAGPRRKPGPAKSKWKSINFKLTPLAFVALKELTTRGGGTMTAVIERLLIAAYRPRQEQ